jgi:hypothetical protein
MTLQEFQDIVHFLYQGDTNTPTESTTDWDVREGLAKVAIHTWDNEKGILWNELWKMLSNASDGDKTIVVATTKYDCPTDFRFPGGYVRLVDSSGNSDYYQVVSPEKAELFRNEDEEICFFTGNKKDGFDLNFISAPTAGLTIEYPYYKESYIPSVAANSFEMSDPYFAVYFTLSKLHELDGEGDRATLALAQAQLRLSNMRTRNVMTPYLQDNLVPDRDFDSGKGGFGI